MRRLAARFFIFDCAFFVVGIAPAATRLVGPGKPYPTPCAAIAAAGANDTIQIDAAGNYAGDVCAWGTNGLTIVGVNGRPKIDAAGKSAQGRGTWVINGSDTVIDNIELSGATNIDLNGAAIRQQGANLTVRNSYFHDNENGILATDLTGSTILIEKSEFEGNGAGDTSSHNVYISHVDKLVFRYNWSHLSVGGNLLNTRASINYILYNRLTGEAGSTDLFELSMPSGGTTFVVGNVIEQPATTQNSVMLNYANEPINQNPDDHLYVVNNTFINDRSNGGTFLSIPATASAAVVTNNIFFGAGAISSQPTTVLSHNYSGTSPGFVDAANYDFRLQSTSPARDAGVDPGYGSGVFLRPGAVYAHPLSTLPRRQSNVLDIGAYEYVGDDLFSDEFDSAPIDPGV